MPPPTAAAPRRLWLLVLAAAPGLAGASRAQSGALPEVIADLTGTWLGLSTAPARVEAALPGDPWVRWAAAGRGGCGNGGENPEARLWFLERPEEEIELAAAAGAEVFRFGVDWGRVFPQRPAGAEEPASESGPSLAAQVWRSARSRTWGRVSIRESFSTVYRSAPSAGGADAEALRRYRGVAAAAREAGMRVMLTLFHHSVPEWLEATGGWLDPRAPDYFLAFAKNVARELGDLVDFWVPFSEANLHVLRSACQDVWPPGALQKARRTGAACFASRRYATAMAHVGQAHTAFYDWAHSLESGLQEPRIGVAHAVALHKASGLFQRLAKKRISSVFQYGLIDDIKGHLDWLGLSYHGKWIDGGDALAPTDTPTEEISETGEILCPQGLLKVLLKFHRRYPHTDPALRFHSVVITEAGIADATDMLRPAHLVEHLLAVREAQRLGVPVHGFVYGAVSDGWEWADGYCPKAGLVAVNRSAADLPRSRRDSFSLFANIARARAVTAAQREESWSLVRRASAQALDRPLCSDRGRVPFAGNDWRLTLAAPPAA